MGTLENETNILMREIEALVELPCEVRAKIYSHVQSRILIVKEQSYSEGWVDFETEVLAEEA